MFLVLVLFFLGSLLFVLKWYQPDHHPRPHPFQRLLVAHRGYSARAMENSLAAFRLAKRSPADAVEFDLQLTRDRKVILMHDPELSRTTTGQGKVSETTLAEIRSLYLKGRRQRIPTLAEALEALQASRLRFLLELKSSSIDHPVLVRKTIEEVRRRGLEERSLFISFEL